MYGKVVEKKQKINKEYTFSRVLEKTGFQPTKVLNYPFKYSENKANQKPNGQKPNPQPHF